METSIYYDQHTSDPIYLALRCKLPSPIHVGQTDDQRLSAAYVSNFSTPRQNFLDWVETVFVRHAHRQVADIVASRLRHLYPNSVGYVTFTKTADSAYDQAESQDQAVASMCGLTAIIHYRPADVLRCQYNTPASALSMCKKWKIHAELDVYKLTADQRHAVLDAGRILYSFDPASFEEHMHDLRHIQQALEWKYGQNKRLLSITVEQARVVAADWVEWLNRRALLTSGVVEYDERKYHQMPLALITGAKVEGPIVFCRLTDKDAYAAEGASMKNCVASYWREPNVANGSGLAGAASGSSLYRALVEDLHDQPQRRRNGAGGGLLSFGDDQANEPLVRLVRGTPASSDTEIWSMRQLVVDKNGVQVVDAGVAMYKRLATIELRTTTQGVTTTSNARHIAQVKGLANSALEPALRQVVDLWCSDNSISLTAPAPASSNSATVRHALQSIGYAGIGINTDGLGSALAASSGMGNLGVSDSALDARILRILSAKAATAADIDRLLLIPTINNGDITSLTP